MDVVGVEEQQPGQPLDCLEPTDSDGELLHTLQLLVAVETLREPEGRRQVASPMEASHRIASMAEDRGDGADPGGDLSP